MQPARSPSWRRSPKPIHLAPLRFSIDAHGGPASGGRLIGKDGEPLDLTGFKTTIEFYLTAVFNVMRLSAAAIAQQEPVDGPVVSSLIPPRLRLTRARSASYRTPLPRAVW